MLIGYDYEIFVDWFVDVVSAIDTTISSSSSLLIYIFVIHCVVLQLLSSLATDLDFMLHDLRLSQSLRTQSTAQNAPIARHPVHHRIEELPLPVANSRSSFTANAIPTCHQITNKSRNCLAIGNLHPNAVVTQSCHLNRQSTITSVANNNVENIQPLERKCKRSASSLLTPVTLSSEAFKVSRLPLNVNRNASFRGTNSSNFCNRDKRRIPNRQLNSNTIRESSKLTSPAAQLSVDEIIDTLMISDSDLSISHRKFEHKTLKNNPATAIAPSNVLKNTSR